MHILGIFMLIIFFVKVTITHQMMILKFSKNVSKGVTVQSQKCVLYINEGGQTTQRLESNNIYTTSNMYKCRYYTLYHTKGEKSILHEFPISHL